jgi:multisubunit Na+/H+ antiporter MnhG subunit
MLYFNLDFLVKLLVLVTVLYLLVWVLVRFPDHLIRFHVTSQNSKAAWLFHMYRLGTCIVFTSTHNDFFLSYRVFKNFQKLLKL